jgi:tRNA modification GTPase
MSFDDTIAAVSTPPGEGGIGIVRLSGPSALEKADRIFISPKGRKLADVQSHTLVYGFIVDPVTGKRIDEVLAGVMRAPRTYTREDVVEFNCHGGMVPLTATLDLLLREGVRLAEPGEFTKRAFLNGRLDLSQAEAVIDVIRARTGQAERIALMQLEGGLSRKINSVKECVISLCTHVEAYIDFPEDEPEIVEKGRMLEAVESVSAELRRLSLGYEEGRFFREGVSAAIVGKPNVGKSSLLNALVQRDRAIVAESPGTTRDVIEDYLNINGLPLRVMDTAGIREAHDLAEVEGVRRSLKAIEGADIVLAVLDAGSPVEEADRELLERVKDKKTVFVINKIDKELVLEETAFGSPQAPVVRVSARTGQGMDELKEAVYALCVRADRLHGEGQEDVLVTNLRHKNAIDRALQAVSRAGTCLQKDEPPEVSALYLRESLDCLGEIVGAVTSEDILNRIFGQFCIGK